MASFTIVTMLSKLFLVAFVSHGVVQGAERMCGRVESIVDGVTIRQVTPTLLELGEGPIWDVRTGRLTFVDMRKGRVFSYNPLTCSLHNITFSGHTVTPFLPSRRRTDVFFAGLNRTLVRLEWDGVASTPTAQHSLATVSEAHPRSHFDDGKADSRGRLWVGTMGRINPTGGIELNAGALYRFTEGATPTKMVAPVSVSNGMAWNRADDAFFYIDSPTYAVVRFDFDAVHGTIANKRILLDTRTAGLGAFAMPDGMTIDAEDNLWVAMFGAGVVLQVNSTSGAILRHVELPAPFVSSCVWGGRHLDVLYVTTAFIWMNETQRREQPTAGSLFSVEGLGTRGLPLFGVDI